MKWLLTKTFRLRKVNLNDGKYLVLLEKQKGDLLEIKATFSKD